MSRFVLEFTSTLTAGFPPPSAAFRGKDGGQQTMGELPEKPHWSCLIVCSVSCLSLPCSVGQEEKGRHWSDPEHTLSTFVITTDRLDLITDPEVAMVIQPNSTRWLNIVCITGRWVLERLQKSCPCLSCYERGSSCFPGFPFFLNYN